LKAPWLLSAPELWPSPLGLDAKQTGATMLNLTNVTASLCLIAAGGLAFLSFLLSH
jgi:hypothetical protein